MRHTYIPGNKWMLPGGGVNKFEYYEDAIKRELKEELNIIIENIELLGVYQLFKESKNDSIVLFLSRDLVDESKIKIDAKEIIEYKFHSLNNLPKDIAGGHLKRIIEYRNKENNLIGKWE